MKQPNQIPKEQLKQQRLEVHLKVRKEKKRKKRMTYSTLLFAMLLILFVTSLRVSPTFASYVAKIPGFTPIVELIAFDRGLEDVVKHDYFEEIGESVTSPENNITVTVVGVAADFTGMSIAYTVEAPFELSQYLLSDIKILQAGEPIPAGFSYNFTNSEGEKYIEDLIQLTNSEGMDYTNRDFALELTFKGTHKGTITVPFSIQQEIKQPKVLAENIELVFQNQKITLEKVTVSPLRASISVRLDENNTMQVLSLDDIKLIDETGEEWASIKNGISANGSARDQAFTMYMQSNYFHEPKTLTLQIGSIAALPKGEDTIKVDLKNKKVLYMPPQVDWDISFEQNQLIVEGENPTEFTRQMLLWARDENGEDVPDIQRTFEDHFDSHFKENVYFKDGITSPITIDIAYFPNFIGENIEVPLK